MLLLWIELWKLQSGHVVDEKVITDLAVSKNALLVSLSDTLSEDSWILSVEQKVDPCEFTVLSGFVVPVASKDVSFFFISINQHRAPVTAALLVSEQTFARDGIKSSSNGIVTVLNPFLG